MKKATIKDYIIDYLLHTIGKGVNLVDWCVEHNVNVQQATETVVDYMHKHNMKSPDDIDRKTLEDMIGVE